MSNVSNSKIAYKGFNVDTNNNLNCRGFIFELNKEYSVTGSPILCKNGFHFCWELNLIHNYYSLNSSVICEVEILGDISNDIDMNKSCTNKIKVTKILTKEDVLKISNSGNMNTGYINTGNRNTGDWNTGDWNTGDWNTGDWNTGNRNTGDRNTGNMNTGNMNTGNMNTGDWNTGDWNTGDRNTGDRNTGDRNTGDWNTGDRNTGDWNTSNYNNGFFNTNESVINIFNIATNITTVEFLGSEFYIALTENYPILTEWIYYTPDEISNDKAKELIGGYLRKYNYKEAHQVWWSKLSDKSKKVIQSIPNFNKEIFEQITGVKT